MQSYPNSAPDFLYDGLPKGAQEFMRSSTPTIQTFTPNGKQMTWTIKRLAHSISRTKTVLLVLWIWLLSWGEKRSFREQVAGCDWDLWERWDSHATPHHLVLLADPQLVDPHTYPGRPWPLSSLTYKHTDQYLRRSFEAIDDILDPSTVMFLGDLFDGGREWRTGATKSPEARYHKYDTAYWLREYERFTRIYVDPWLKGSVTSAHKDRRMISTIPGNHDLGLGHGIQLPVRDRFETYFGFGNRIDSIGNHTIVSIDSVSLSARQQFEGSDGHATNPALWKPTEDFLAGMQAHKLRVASRARHQQLKQPENTLQNHTAMDMGPISTADQWAIKDQFQAADAPTIILSHMPFWREPDTPCGPKRERHPPALGDAFDPDAKDPRNAISVTYGYQYQNVLSKDLSIEVVKAVGNVKHIFSGDDHDYCELIHKDLDAKQPKIPEITVKSTSWAMGVRKPGFLLVSLWNPLDGGRASVQTIQTNLCLLPEQLSIFISYLQLIVVTLLVLAIRSFIFRKTQLKNSSKAEPLLPTPATTPTFPKSLDTRDRSDSGSYSSSSSNGKTLLNARSGRGQALGLGLNNPLAPPSPSEGGYLSPARAYSPAYSHANDSRWKPTSVSTRHVSRGLLGRPLVRDFLTSVLHVAVGAFLWYWWLARTV